MFIIVAGAGKVGYHLARALIADHEILVIELDPARCDFVGEELGAEVVMQGDACDVATMERAGMERADLVAAVTGDDDDNLTVCQMAKAKFSVPRTVARINNGRGLEIVEVRVPAEAMIVGRAVRNILLPQGALLCLVIDQEGTPRLPTPDTMVHADDIVVAVTNIDGEEGLREALTSPRP